MFQPILVCLLPEEFAKPLALIDRKHRLQRNNYWNQTAVMLGLECSHSTRKLVKKVDVGHDLANSQSRNRLRADFMVL